MLRLSLDGSSNALVEVVGEQVSKAQQTALKQLDSSGSDALPKRRCRRSLVGALLEPRIRHFAPRQVVEVLHPIVARGAQVERRTVSAPVAYTDDELHPTLDALHVFMYPNKQNFPLPYLDINQLTTELSIHPNL